MEESKKEKGRWLQLAQTIMTAAILAIMIVVGAAVVTGLNSVRKNMVMIEQDLNQIDMDEINATIKSLNKAADSLGNVDMDALNGLIESLNHTAETLENISGVIGGLFGK